MENFDLNIEHYDYTDILDLFDLKKDHSYIDLKQAFKIVAKTHPDKSKLPKDYFLFFKRAYKILLEMYKIRHKKNNYRDDFHEKDKELLSEKLTKADDFHTTFNRLFEKTTKQYFTQSGHGDWLKEEGDEVEKVSSTREMREYFAKKKKELSAIQKYDSIRETQSNSSQSHSNLYGEEPESYTSGMFSKLQYEDVKTAHDETIIPVSEEQLSDMKKFRNVQQLQEFRQKQNLSTMNKEDSKEYLENKERELDNEHATKLYELLQKEENTKKMNDKWWGMIKQLKN